MRHFIVALFLLIMTSCKNEKATGRVGSSYPENPVGSNKDGAYTLEDPKGLAKEWQTNIGGDIKLTGFEIIKSHVEGNPDKEFYMVMARTEDANTTAAALVRLKGDKFYFGREEKSNSDSYVIITCKGDCASGCLPVMMTNNGSDYLVCSPCADCAKDEKEVR